MFIQGYTQEEAPFLLIAQQWLFCYEEKEHYFILICYSDHLTANDRNDRRVPHF